MQTEKASLRQGQDRGKVSKGKNGEWTNAQERLEKSGVLVRWSYRSATTLSETFITITIRIRVVVT